MTEPRIEKAVLGSVRLDSDVWDAVRAMPVSLNVYLREALLNGKPRKVSKAAQVVAERAASDTSAQLAGRADEIDYGDIESQPFTSVAKLDAQKITPRPRSTNRTDAYQARGMRQKGDKGR